MAVAPKILGTILNAPLPELVEKLGLAVANAQMALDQNSIAVANAMATTFVRVNNQDYDLISLGFAPTFYAFTEATIEAKMEFSLVESEDLSVSVSGQFGNASSEQKDGKRNTTMFGISMNASYARKFEASASASSSIAARLVSLPPPERFRELLSGTAVDLIVPVTEVKVSLPGNLTDITGGDSILMTATVLPANATEKGVIWTVVGELSDGNPTPVEIFADGRLKVPDNADAHEITVKAVSKDNADKFGELKINVV